MSTHGSFGQSPVAATDAPLQIKRLRTIEPASLRISDRDRWTGGLPKKVLFRMAADSQGRILVTDPYSSLIQVLDIEGGNYLQLKGDRVQAMRFPTYIAVDADDDIYVSEPTLGAVLVFFPDGRFARMIGGDELTLPFGLAIDKSNGRLFVVDHERGAIEVYSLDGKFLTRIGSRGRSEGEMRHPTDIVFEGGTLYVLDAGNSRFEIFGADGEFKAVLPFGDNRAPLAIAVDKASRLYCVDGYSLGLLVLDTSGKQLATYGVRVPYGQPTPAERTPAYTSLAERADGTILGLRPTLEVDVLKLETPAPKEQTR